VDDIEFKHKAHGRAGFALGAVLAAEWLQGKKGFYSVKDMFDFNS
jgi:4-hydroxy-tetrahydrodipicolinate reductase